MTNILSAIHDSFRQTAQEDFGFNQSFDGPQSETMEVLQSKAKFVIIGGM